MANECCPILDFSTISTTTIIATTTAAAGAATTGDHDN